jgi:hypothetical protein
MVPREPSDIARIGMLGAKRELLSIMEESVPSCARERYSMGPRGRRSSPPHAWRTQGARHKAPCVSTAVCARICAQHPRAYDSNGARSLRGSKHITLVVSSVDSQHSLRGGLQRNAMRSSTTSYPPRHTLREESLRIRLQSVLLCRLAVYLCRTSLHLHVQAWQLRETSRHVWQARWDAHGPAMGTPEIARAKRG